MKSKNKNTLSKMKAKADKEFSLYVRYRDGKQTNGSWEAQCITCERWLPLKQMHAGHFQSRRYSSTRYDKENVNAQCAGCNTFNQGEQYKYAKALEVKYGEGTAEKLAHRAQEFHKLTVNELQEIIDDSKSFCSSLDI